MLKVSKDQMLATCGENELKFVTNPTSQIPPDCHTQKPILLTRALGQEELPDTSVFPRRTREPFEEINQTMNALSYLSVDLNGADIENQETSQLKNSLHQTHSPSPRLPSKT
ncbi:hypothetical protein P691DRAFT_759533 [Macrolepiota fuliginosa MF-IS2]|uniref:Uncharacterized protein n=1 Tax=Macrolepiota fuliginosa MF-IS2 TaxID=1400762 RepID=A0A9P5XGL1_9AGAR|nr:hypothetical protein P691DRAFT_759533 [Macrolepiota fuliginosa MF-IS2]